MCCDEGGTAKNCFKFRQAPFHTFFLNQFELNQEDNTFFKIISENIDNTMNLECEIPYKIKMHLKQIFH